MSGRAANRRRAPRWRALSARALAGLAALALSGACAHQIDEDAKKSVDGQVGFIRPTGQMFAPPTTWEPQPLAVGQWTRYRIVDGDGHPNLVTYKIVGQQGGAFWFEVRRETYYGRSATKMLATLGDRRNPDTVDVRMVLTKDTHGRIDRYDAQTLIFVKSLVRNALGILQEITWRGQLQEDAAVPAGTFAGCFKVRGDDTRGSWRGTGTSWSHPAVPINGLVKAEATGEGLTMDLIGFGQTGAESEF